MENFSIKGISNRNLLEYMPLSVQLMNSAYYVTFFHRNTLCVFTHRYILV